MPLSLLEAMSYGNCCLVSDIEECTSVIEDKAHIFNKSDIQSLKDKIQELLDKPKLVQGYKSESTYYICNKYNWDNIVNQTLILYKEKKNDSNSAMCK